MIIYKLITITMSTIIETGSKGKQLKTRVQGFEDSREKIKTGVEDSRGLGFMGTDEEGDRVSLYIESVYKH